MFSVGVKLNGGALDGQYFNIPQNEIPSNMPEHLVFPTLHPVLIYKALPCNKLIYARHHYCNETVHYTFIGYTL